MSSSRARSFVLLLVVAGLLAAASLSPVGIADAAEPSSGEVAPSSPETAWTGQLLLNGAIGEFTCTDLWCDTYALTITSEGQDIDVKIEVEMPGFLDDLYVEVRGPSGEVVASEVAIGQADILLEQPEEGTYTIQTSSQLQTTPRDYQGRAFVRLRPNEYDLEGAPEDTVLHPYEPGSVQAEAEVPLRVVMVGFDEDEIDEEAVLAQIPDHQQVGVLQMYEGAQSPAASYDLFGLDTLVNHGRAYFDGTPEQVLPIRYRWKPELHVAPSGFARELFQEMLDGSTTGDFHTDTTRVFLERYNLERGTPFRLQASGGDPSVVVPPMQDVRFIDAERTEDWVAENTERWLGFPAVRDPGVAGYTVFFLNTWDSPEAQEILPRDEYHVFLAERDDPDTEEFSGIDWGRLWGGRYRFFLIDLGAAPNPYEAETWGNRNRSINSGSAQYDPPLWEVRANAPRILSTANLADGIEQAVAIGETWDDAAFHYTLARTVNGAVNFRFFHAYLYEPRPGTGRFFLSDNIWHDQFALTDSRLEDLYDQETALEGLRTLTPYFDFQGDASFQYLGDPPAGREQDYAADQAALDASKQGGDDLAGAPHVSMRTTLMMDYIDSVPERFLRGGHCATTVPTIQVVVPGHYAWALPVAAGIATNRNGVPWGFLNSVNDVTKSRHADTDPTLAMFHPEPFGGAFTYTTIHEASHYLGLAHPHDTVGAIRGEDGEPVYYSGFAWTFNSTAAPTTYSHAEIVYGILDQESIARGHLAYYLSWTEEALRDAGVAWMDRDVATLGELPPRAAEVRTIALRMADEARARFADFDFVEATFAAQEAWRGAAEYRDLAFELEPGSSQLEYGTQTGTDAEVADCFEPATGSPAAPQPVRAVPDDGQVAGGASPSGPLPVTGGGPGLVSLVLVGLAMLLGRRLWQPAR